MDSFLRPVMKLPGELWGTWQKSTPDSIPLMDTRAPIGNRKTNDSNKHGTSALTTVLGKSYFSLEGSNGCFESGVYLNCICFNLIEKMIMCLAKYCGNWWVWKLSLSPSCGFSNLNVKTYGFVEMPKLVEVGIPSPMVSKWNLHCKGDKEFHLYNLGPE